MIAGGTPDEQRVKERFYLIIGKKGNDTGNVKGFLHKHAIKYDQEAVLLKPYDSEIAEVHHRDGRIQLAGKWHPDRIREFYGMLKWIDRDFVFDKVHFLESGLGSTELNTIFVMAIPKAKSDRTISSAGSDQIGTGSNFKT